MREKECFWILRVAEGDMAVGVDDGVEVEDVGCGYEIVEGGGHCGVGLWRGFEGGLGVLGDEVG